MPDFDKLTVLSQIEIAVHQLEKSISLFINEKDFICTITLAGAADGILGGLLKKQGKKTTHDQHKEILRKHNHGLTDKELNDLHLNMVRNEFKHVTRDENETKDYALETESILYITRGISNYILLKQELTIKMADFINWARINRPDVTDPNSKVEIIRP